MRLDRDSCGFFLQQIKKCILSLALVGEYALSMRGDLAVDCIDGDR